MADLANLDPGYESLSKRDQLFAKLFAVAAAEGEVDFECGNESSAKQARMNIYAFRRKVRGEHGKRKSFPHLAVLIEDFTVTIEGTRVIVREQAAAPELKGLGEVLEAKERQLKASGRGLVEVVREGWGKKAGEGAPAAPQQTPATSAASDEELKESQRRLLEELERDSRPSPVERPNNPYYTRD